MYPEAVSVFEKMIVETLARRQQDSYKLHLWSEETINKKN